MIWAGAGDPERDLPGEHRWDIHPAIVAGRIRHETGNYRLLSQLVGTGKVRQQFEGA